MPYKVMEIFMDLPKTNCGYCGKPGCLPFATSVYLEGFALSACPQLEPDKLAQMEAKLAASREAEGGGKEESVVQALKFLKDKIASLDLEEIAKNSGAEYLAEPTPTVRVHLFGQPYLVTIDSVLDQQGRDPSVWVKVFVLIYLTRANGKPNANKWVAFRELPDTGPKLRDFEANAAKIAAAYSGKISELDTAASALSGERVESESADRSYVFSALPRIGLNLLFWDGDEDFESRVTLLVDQGILDYLDPEAITFLSDAFAALMLGEDLAEVVG